MVGKTFQHTETFGAGSGAVSVRKVVGLLLVFTKRVQSLYSSTSKRAMERKKQDGRKQNLPIQFSLSRAHVLQRRLRHGDLHEHSNSWASKTICSAEAVTENFSVRWNICTSAMRIAWNQYALSTRVRLATQREGRGMPSSRQNEPSRTPSTHHRTFGVRHVACGVSEELVQSPSGWRDFAGAALQRNVGQASHFSQSLSQCVRTCT